MFLQRNKWLRTLVQMSNRSRDRIYVLVDSMILLANKHDIEVPKENPDLIELEYIDPRAELNLYVKKTSARGGFLML